MSEPAPARPTQPVRWLLVLDSIHDVLAAERLLKDRRVWCDVVPVPRDLRADCGMAIAVRLADLAAVETALADFRYRLQSASPLPLAGAGPGAGAGRRSPSSSLSSTCIYLDHAATSWPKPPEVRDEIARSLAGLAANAGRSGHGPSLESARTVFEARRLLAALLGVSRPENLVFTRGCTESINLVLKGFLKPGARVAVSPLEHNAVMRPLARLVRQRGIVVETLPADPFGRIDVEAARRLARRKRFDLAAVQHASNVNGAVQNLGALREAFAETPLLVDGAQTAGVLPIAIERDGIDFFACSLHKGLRGPTGVGLCYLGERFDVEPLIEGGTGSASDAMEQPAFRPDRYEAGTLNLLGIAGALGAARALAERGPQGGFVRRLTTRLLSGLSETPGVCLHSPRDGTALCAAFNVEGVAPDEAAARLESRFSILCRPGLQCAPAAHRHLGTFPAGAVRLSPGYGNTEEMVEIALEAIRSIVEEIGP